MGGGEIQNRQKRKTETFEDGRKRKNVLQKVQGKKDENRERNINKDLKN